MTDDELLKIVSQFDILPDAAVVPTRVAVAVTGNCIGEQQWRRDPPIPRRQISPMRFGFVVGDLRRLLRGEKFPSSAKAALPSPEKIKRADKGLKPTDPAMAVWREQLQQNLDSMKTPADVLAYVQKAIEEIAGARSGPDRRHRERSTA